MAGGVLAVSWVLDIGKLIIEVQVKYKQTSMEDRINEVLAEDSVDDSMDSKEITPSQFKEKAKASRSFEKRSEEERTIKIVMGAKPMSAKEKPKLDPPTSDNNTPRSKLKLSGRLKNPAQLDENKKTYGVDTERQSKASMKEYEAASLQMAENQTSRSFRKNNPFASELEHTRLRTNMDKPINLKATQVSESFEKAKSDRQEFQIFYEQETNYSFWSFICSKEIPMVKKLVNAIYLIFFILTSTFSVISLVHYTDSSCRQSLSISVVYYIFFGIGMLLKFSMYIFLQLELHGKVIYTLKVSKISKVSTSDPAMDIIRDSSAAGRHLRLRLQDLQQHKPNIRAH